MKRREFITLLGGAVASWPLAARAQQGGRVRRIGVLMNLTADDPESVVRVAAFQTSLQELGWSVGRNLRIDHRYALGDPDRLRRSAEELVALAPDVILQQRHGRPKPARFAERASGAMLHKMSANRRGILGRE